MITKLIIFIIIVNVVGSLLKNWQEKKRKEARMREGLDGQLPAAGNELPEQEPESPFASGPEDLFAALMEPSEKHTREKEAEYAAPPPPPVYNPDPQASAPLFQPAVEERPVFEDEYEKIRAGKSIIDTKEAEKGSPSYLIQPEAAESVALASQNLAPSAAAVVTRDNTMGLHRLFTRGGLRQGVIYHEILGTPKGLQ